jgi:hypothetical protein
MGMSEPWSPSEPWSASEPWFSGEWDSAAGERGNTAGERWAQYVIA